MARKGMARDRTCVGAEMDRCLSLDLSQSPSCFGMHSEHTGKLLQELIQGLQRQLGLGLAQTQQV